MIGERGKGKGERGKGKARKELMIVFFDNAEAVSYLTTGPAISFLFISWHPSNVICPFFSFSLLDSE